MNTLWLKAYLSAVRFSLLLTTLLLELHVTHVHNSGCDLVNIITLFISEVQDAERVLL